MEFDSKVLVTGANGFTGRHLCDYLTEKGLIVHALLCDITNQKEVNSELTSIKPKYVIHLAGISYANHTDFENIYRVNTVGSINLLEACRASNSVNGVIIASSASIYEGYDDKYLDENLCPKPRSHYSCSKLSTEFISKKYEKYFSITIVRPFNYTGLGHGEKFVIPKIVKSFIDRDPKLILGNLDIFREFNDVRDICRIYYELLNFKHEYLITNICSGRVVSLKEVIDILRSMTEHNPIIKTDPTLVRKNDPKIVCGSVSRLSSLVKLSFDYSINDTLNWMLEDYG